MKTAHNATYIDPLRPRVVIVGAGAGGLAYAIALRERLGFDNFTIYEKGNTVGGVWRDHTYPGCGSDIPGHWYSLSTDLYPDWRTYYVGQPELQEYWHYVFKRRQLVKNTVFNTQVVRATWDSAEQVYHIVLEDTTTKERRNEDANVLLWAAGVFVAPFLPEDVPGASSFRGEVWHSARWRHDVDLKGKRVGVIGNGCSAAQLIPQISTDPSVKVINFARSPQWYIPRPQFEFSSLARWVFRNIPFAMRLYRARLMANADSTFGIWLKGSTDNEGARQLFTQYMLQSAPKEYHDKLIPDYPVGCKRVIVDPSFLASLYRQNVDLNWTKIDSIVEDGLKLATGEVVKLDVIVFATGYSVAPPRLTGLNVFGRDGQSLDQYWESAGGAEAYLGLAVPNYPNFYMLLGPNTASGHASVLFNEEVQAQHAAQLIGPVVQGKASSFEVRPDVFKKYNEWVQSTLDKTVWTDCQSYYRGRDRNGKNTTLYPGSITRFWWAVRKVNFQDYIAVGAEKMVREKWLRQVLQVAGIALLLAGMVIGWYRPDFVAVKWRMLRQVATTLKESVQK